MLRVLAAIFVYTAAAAGANAADPAELAALREGTLKKMVFHAEPKAVSDRTFGHLDGGEHRLADFSGDWVVLNFWATWCAPCRAEMPSLQDLQRKMNGAVRVVTVATGRNSPQGIRKFFEEENITELPEYVDPPSMLARDMAVLGLPITVIMNPDGLEVARLRGDAEWDSESALAIMRALTADAGG